MQSYNVLMLNAFPESPESPSRPIGLLGVLVVVPKEGTIGHASMSGFALLTLSENGVPQVLSPGINSPRKHIWIRFAHMKHL